MVGRSLPGTVSPYLLPSGSGRKLWLAGQLVTLIARNEDTGDALEAAIVSGGRHGAFPRHRHDRGHEVLLVLDGVLDLTLDDERYRLVRGDYASIPAGTVHGYQMRAHHTTFLMWTVHGAATVAWNAIGDPTTAPAYPPTVTPPLDASRLPAAADLTIVADSGTTRNGVPRATPPAGVSPYVLEAGDGERLVAGDQVFAFLSHGGNTDATFITLSTIGPAGDRIPEHFHERHTETFFCLDGCMTMWAHGSELKLLPGDFLHVPPGTTHSYRLDSNYTRFVGLLSPGIFEPFFRTLCDPYDAHIFPVTPGPARFDRVIQRLGDLDLTLVEPPR